VVASDHHRQRPPEADRIKRSGDFVSRGVDHADAHLLLVLLGPVGRASERGGDGRANPGRD
jgi:hypothetical protein